MAEGGGTAPAEPGLSLEVAPIHKGKRAQSVRGASMVPTDTGGGGGAEHIAAHHICTKIWAAGGSLGVEYGVGGGCLLILFLK